MNLTNLVSLFLNNYLIYYNLSKFSKKPLLNKHFLFYWKSKNAILLRGPHGLARPTQASCCVRRSNWRGSLGPHTTRPNKRWACASAAQRGSTAQQRRECASVARRGIGGGPTKQPTRGLPNLAWRFCKNAPMLLSI